MLKSLKFSGIAVLVLFVFGCATAPQTSEDAAGTESAETAQPEQTAEEPQWVTVTMDEYFVSQETIKYDDGFIDGYRLFEYDDNGLILKQTHIGSDESIISEEVYFYDNGLLVRSEYRSGQELISQSVFSYDGQRMLVEESFMNAKGELQGVSSYEYDSSDRKTKWISGDSGGIPMMYTEYEYNEENLVRMSYFLPTGQIEGYTQLEYRNGLLMEEATYSPSSKLEKKTEYVYDGETMVRALFYFGRNLSRTIEYLYDENGNVAEEKTLNRNGDVTDIIAREYVMIPVTRQVLR